MQARLITGRRRAACADMVTARATIDVARGTRHALGSELITVVLRADADDRLARKVADQSQGEHPEVAVVGAGGQARYPLLLGVE